MDPALTPVNYDIDDPVKIQGRDEIRVGDRSLAAIRLQRALDAIGDNAGPLLLLGAGAGRYARAMSAARPDIDHVAGDLSAVAIHEAVSMGGGSSYLVLDAQQLPFVDASFGAVVFFDLLEHVPDPLLLLSECARVLRPDGVLHFFVPLEDQPRTLYRLFKRDRPVPIHRWKRDHVGHIQRYSRNNVVALAWRAELAVTDLSYSFHLVGQIHDVIDYWHRERTRGGQGVVPLPVVRAATRGAFIATWRLSWLEDRLYAGPMLASGLHVTARPARADSGSFQLKGHGDTSTISNYSSRPDRAARTGSH